MNRPNLPTAGRRRRPCVQIIRGLPGSGKSTLAAPPRNCDVGTADEQEDRFERFCDTHKYVGDDGANICSQDCPCYNNLDCGVRWSQMPYEEGSEDEGK